jgi:DNA-binding NarL/FixJ family response regulator
MQRLLIAGSDDFTSHAQGLASQYVTGIYSVRVGDDEADVRDVARRLRPDIAVVDGSEDADRALAAVRAVRAEAPDALVVFVTRGAPAATDGAMRAFEAGAVVMHMRGAAVSRLEVARRERPLELPVWPPSAEPGARPTSRWPLTSREVEILRCAAEGNTNTVIARRLWVTERTVKFHLSNIYRKLNVSNRTEASRLAMEMGLVETATAGVAAPQHARTA